MSETPDDISDMEQRIRKMQKKTTDIRKPSQTRVFIDAAFRTVLEFIAPVIVSLCLGYMIDLLFNIKPIATVISALFGCAAGVLNLYRMGKQIERRIKD